LSLAASQHADASQLYGFELLDLREFGRLRYPYYQDDLIEQVQLALEAIQRFLEAEAMEWQEVVMAKM
jgi:lactam utilization protein B